MENSLSTHEVSQMKLGSEAYYEGSSKGCGALVSPVWYMPHLTTLKVLLQEERSS